MVLIFVLIVTFSVAQSAAIKRHNKYGGDAVVFNFLRSIAAFFCMVLVGLGGFTLHTPTLIYGGIFGVVLALSMFAGFKALRLGTLSLTSLICACSVIIPITYGVVFCNEAITLFKIIGFVFLAATLVSVNVGKKTDGDNQSYGKWIFYTLLTFLSNGICSVIQKAHQTSFPEKYQSEFMICAMGICVIFFAIVTISAVSREKRHVAGKKYALIAGISCGLANFFTVKLSGLENASVLYPMISAGTIIGTLIFGCIVFKERLKPGQIVALICGIFSVVFLKL